MLWWFLWVVEDGEFVRIFWRFLRFILIFGASLSKTYQPLMDIVGCIEGSSIKLKFRVDFKGW